MNDPEPTPADLFPKPKRRTAPRRSRRSRSREGSSRKSSSSAKHTKMLTLTIKIRMLDGQPPEDYLNRSLMFSWQNRSTRCGRIIKHLGTEDGCELYEAVCRKVADPRRVYVFMWSGEIQTQKEGGKDA